MTDKEHKQAVLDASVIILQEYKTYKHRSLLSSCELCKRFFNYLEEKEENECGDCPMALFEAFKGVYHGCTLRKCRMVNQLDSFFAPVKVDLKKTKRVIEFYEEFIKLVKSSRHCRLKTKSGNTSLFARRLKILDTNIFFKYER